VEEGGKGRRGGGKGRWGRGKGREEEGKGSGGGPEKQRREKEAEEGVGEERVGKEGIEGGWRDGVMVPFLTTGHIRQLT